VTENNQDEAFDFILDFTLSAVENSNDAYSQPMIFNVGGLLVSGHLISESQYLREVQGGAIHKGIARIWEKGEPNPADNDTEKEALTPFEYVHLKNARFFLSDKNPIPGTGGGALWRGKLSSIDGYVFGEIQAAGK